MYKRNLYTCKVKRTAKELLDFLIFSKLTYCNKLVFSEFIKFSQNGEYGHLLSRY